MSEDQTFVMKYIVKRTGQVREERPRLAVSVDGKEHSLVIGEGEDIAILARGARENGVALLWVEARARIETALALTQARS